MRYFIAIFLLVANIELGHAQIQTGTIHIEVLTAGKPVADAEVIVAGVAYRTGAEGQAAIVVAPGTVEVTVIKDGFVHVTTVILVAAGREHQVRVDLESLPRIEEEVTVVAATRTAKRLDDQPMRVEVLTREEIEEKMLMTPGDIVMTLNEMGGMRVQATSPGLGAASVRIQGMRGRYTRFLSDGLPLFGEQVGGLGLLQIPPMDLGRIEIIKGVASALYGGGAMGGVVNLISRRPTKEPVRELLVNRSERGATDTVMWIATPVTAHWGLSVLGGGHWQEQTDVDHDAWTDLPHYARGVVRPRLFWDDGNGQTFFATVGASHEDRFGGTIGGAALPATGTPYREGITSTRWDGGAVGQFLMRRKYVVTGRIAVGRQNHDHQFGEIREGDRHRTTFGEVALRSSSGRHTWVSGFALDRNTYIPLDVPRFAYTFNVPGAFAQDDIDVAPWLAVSASARIDHHTAYGTFFSPRLSALFRKDGWSSRLSSGTGFFGPTFLTEETEAAGLSRLTVPRPLVAERGHSVSLDITRTSGPASGTVTLFASRIRNPLHVERTAAFVLSNLSEATTNRGGELIGTLRREPVEFTLTYTYVRARESEGDRRAEVPLTPRHTVALIGVIELEGRGRIGLEGYYTGRQRLEDNPFRDESPSYAIVGFLAEVRFGPARLFLNGENLTNVRQSRWDPLLLPRRGADGRWTVDEWAPLEGRVLNGGLRWNF